MHNRVNKFLFYHRVSKEINKWYQGLYSSIFGSDNNRKKRSNLSITNSDSGGESSGYKMKKSKGTNC